MGQGPETDRAALASALLQVVPKLLLRLRADVPLDSLPLGDQPGLSEASELRTTPGQLSLLQQLVEHERCTMQELAEHLAVVPSTVTAMVKRLLAQGYVERAHDELDWRAVWVKPTERGRQVVAVYNQARRHSLQQRLAQLSPEDLQALAAALPALRHLLDA